MIEQQRAGRFRSTGRRHRWLIIAAVVVVVLVVAASAPVDVAAPLGIAAVAAFLAYRLWRSQASALARTTGLVALCCAGVGAVLLYIGPLAVAGVVVLCLAAAAGVPFLTELILGWHGGRNSSHLTREATPTERSVALVTGVCLAIAVVGLTAISMRGSDGYYMRYGTAVTATTGDGCRQVQDGHVGGSRYGPYQYIISCRNASWQIGGATVHGLLTSTVTKAASFGAAQVPAYAIGGDARAAVGLKSGGPLVVLGRLPQFWPVVPFMVTFVVWIVTMVLGWRRAPATR